MNVYYHFQLFFGEETRKNNLLSSDSVSLIFCHVWFESFILHLNQNPQPHLTFLVAFQVTFRFGLVLQFYCAEEQGHLV
ncbi:hypothetical protein FRX31_007566 [Thalictrum thalictroides]|uniref:Uncharacterized protein n=1 Tax=Thalictrum thalictroides TaxID=46969 RepID=A0A7J6X0I3_THATH|nr:hypothetical protein FRX31_007566 [Thalictrum thalictroides]